MDNRARITQAILTYSLNPTSEQMLRSIADIESLFGLSVADRLEAFRKQVWAWNFKNNKKYEPDVIEAFINYWGRTESSGKLKHEERDKFKIGGRLATFAKNQPKIAVNKRIADFKRTLGQVDPLR